MLLVRQDITEPADVPADGQDRPQNADGSVRDHAGEDQRDAEGQDNRPRRWRWQLHRVRCALLRFRVASSCFSPLSYTCSNVR